MNPFSIVGATKIERRHVPKERHRWAIIEDGVVVNVVVAERQPDFLLQGGQELVNVDDNPVGPGDMFEDGGFSRPAVAEAATVEQKLDELLRAIAEAESIDDLKSRVQAQREPAPEPADPPTREPRKG